MAGFWRLFREQLRIGHIFWGVVSYAAVSIVVNLLIRQQAGAAQIQADMILGGVARSLMRGDIDYLAYSRWLVILAFPMIVISLLAAQARYSFLFTLLRVGSIKRIWRSLCLTVLLHILLYVLLLGGLTMAFANARLQAASMTMLLLLFIHLSLVGVIALRLLLMRAHRTAPVVAILMVEGLTFFAAQRCPGVASFMPGTWSMYLQSSFSTGAGFPVNLVLLAELAFICVCSFAVPDLRTSTVEEGR